jgi:hypothetical protein
MVAEPTAQDRASKAQSRIDKLSTPEDILLLKYTPELIEELSNHVTRKSLFDAILIDASETGFLFTAETLIESAALARNLLQLQGTMLWIKAEKAIGIKRDSIVGNCSFTIFDSYAELFDYSPALTARVRDILGKTDSFQESTDLSQQVLMSVIPVLTKAGINAKGAIENVNQRISVLAAIDNFTALSGLSERLVKSGRMTFEELLEEIKFLEDSKLIYPVLAKIPFLVNCFSIRTPFSLDDYLIAAKLVTRVQLDELVAESRAAINKDHITVGALALKKGYINARQLEVAINDLSFYGQAGGRDGTRMMRSGSEETQLQSLVGYLGSTDPSNLLQNLVQNREGGVLSVEHKDQHFRAMFDAGKLTHAKVGKILGNQAVVQFASAWHEGIFVFMKRTPPPDLSVEECKLTKMLDNLLLDAALAKDNMEVVNKKLPNGIESILEKAEDTKNLLGEGKFKDPSEGYDISEAEVVLMRRLWNELDGLTTLVVAVKRLSDVALYKGMRAADLLRHYGLVTIPENNLDGPLKDFNFMVKSVSEKIGRDRNTAFLRLSMRDTVGYTQRARMFAITSSGEVGLDMAAARKTGASLSLVVQDIENWQVQYIEYVSQEVPSELLLSIIREIHPEVESADN